MALNIQGQVGLQLPKLATGVNAQFSQGNLGESLVSEVMARYYQLAYNGLVFSASHSAAQALSVNSTTFTGLAVSNPANSGKNLVILDVSIAIAAAVAAVTTPRLGYAAIVALTAGNSVGPTAAIVGNAGGVAKVGASGTLGAAPVSIRPIMGVDWVTGGTPVAMIYTKDDVGGAIIIPPGQMLTLDSLVGACSVLAGFTWAEIAV
jgi:hypothetical protein